MKLSDLIEDLEFIKEKNGNLDVCVDNPDEEEDIEICIVRNKVYLDHTSWLDEEE